LLNKAFLSDYRYFPDIYVSQGSVAWHSKSGAISNDHFITYLLLSKVVKKFWRSVNIWQSYKQVMSCFFLPHGVWYRG